MIVGTIVGIVGTEILGTELLSELLSFLFAQCRCGDYNSKYMAMARVVIPSGLLLSHPWLTE